jgi:hypothetical protein
VEYILINRFTDRYRTDGASKNEIEGGVDSKGIELGV